MINQLKNKLTIRKGFIFGVIILVISNFLFITVYYRLFLNSRINEQYQKTSNELKEELTNIIDTIPHIDNISSYLEEYANNNEILLTLSNTSNKIVETYGYTNKNERKNVTASQIINYNNDYYLLSISKEINTINLKIALDFLYFEIINILVLALTGIFISNIKILSPITALSKDLNNYKLGIIPHKRKVKSEIDSLQNDFVDLVNTLEEEHKNQNRIIASISHDIKTPLTSILGYSERLLTSDLNETTKKKYITTIHNKSLVMKEIVEEFDDYLSCNIKDDSKTEKISIKYIIDYLNNYYKEDLQDQNIDFKVKTNCSNAIIEVDLAKFKRIFSNTITNSIRHYNKQKKILNITINQQKNNMISFEIADNGSGCKADLNKIFEPLYTTDKSRKISGLGLSICKEIVNSHGGSITAENNKLGGFSIIFTIPEYKE